MTERMTVSSVSLIAWEVKRVPSKLTSRCRSGFCHGNFLVDLGDEIPHRQADLDVVFTVLLLNAEAERQPAIAARHAAPVGHAVLNRGDVAQVDVRVIKSAGRRVA